MQHDSASSLWSVIQELLMPSSIAAVFCALGILGLFVLDRYPKVRTSVALWIPVIWIWINGSRPVSQWLQRGDFADTPSAVLDGSPLDALIYGILLVLGLIALVARKQRVAAVLRTSGPVLLFFFYCGISVLWSDFPFVAFKRWTKSLGDLVMVLIVLTDLDPIAAIGRLLKRTGFVLLPVSILLIKYYPDLGRGYSRWEGTLFNVGVTTNKNLLGMICLILGLGSLWRFLQSYENERTSLRRRHLFAQGIIVGMAIWLLWLSNSMTSLSCFGLAAVLILMTHFFTIARKPIAIHFLVLTILVTSVFSLFFGGGGEVLAQMGRNSTLTGRTDIWRLVLGMGGNPIIGTGFESFWLGDRLSTVWNIYYFHLNEAHNGYIEVFLNLGWVGIALLSVLVLSSYRNITRSFRQEPETASFRLSYLLVAVIYSLTEAGFRMLNPMWLFFLLVVSMKTKLAATVPGEQSETAVAGEISLPVRVAVKPLRYIEQTQV